MEWKNKEGVAFCRISDTTVQERDGWDGLLYVS